MARSPAFDAAVLGALPRCDEAVADVIEVLLVVGEVACARRVCDSYFRVPLTSRWSTLDTPEERRARATISAAAGDLRGALDLLDSTTAHLEDGTPPVEMVHFLLIRGTLRHLCRSDGASADLERAATIGTRHGLERWHAAALRALHSCTASDQGLQAPSGPREIVTTLTAGYWGGNEIGEGLRRALAVVELTLGALRVEPRGCG